MKKIRLDVLLVSRNLAPSRERAQAHIMAGDVFVAGQRALKPGQAVPEDAIVELRGEKMPYVSRGGKKLARALEVFPISPAGQCCIDCGASTGGFTDCLLQNGARFVYAVDVGYGQLDYRLRTDPRVSVMERTNIRHLTPQDLDEPPSFATMDLSFISLGLILPVITQLLTESGQAICLIKPQFEAGREHVGKKGVVRDPHIHEMVLNRFIQQAEDADFTVLGLDHSPIRGPEGNIEYLAYIAKGDVAKPPHLDIQETVAHAQESL